MKKSNKLNLLNEFFESEKSGGVVLIVCTIISIIAANSWFGEAYTAWWHQKIDLSFRIIQLNYSLQHWINDGLMTVFFLSVGLEIERELYIGELSNFKSALLPVIAALGGMIVPAAIHYGFNSGTNTQSGIGIPMATDIAFALGVLSLAGKKVPASLKIFLTAFAIIDDMGAIVIIALFYTKNILFPYLLAALGIYIVIIALNRLKVYKLAPFLILGVIMWYCMLKSGVHATIMGVLLAFAIPFRKGEDNPSLRLQHLLHKPVTFIILPVFAAANTALLINSESILSLLSPNSMGIIFGLLLGKPVGILFFSLAGIKLKVFSYPENTGWKHFLGAGMLGGIGFTMSIFISNLAFNDSVLIQDSIISILIASLFSGISGLVFLKSIKSE